MGHYFALAHTFENSDHQTVSKRELVTRSGGRNCDSEGDLSCDTPADPYPHEGSVENCVYESSSVDANGEHFNPDLFNFMSYYNYLSCKILSFTPNQYKFIRSATSSPFRTLLNAPAANVAQPSQLKASLIDNGVNLTWKDNAVNEAGYLIEHSLYPDSGFIPVDAVGKDVIAFNDFQVLPNTLYYLRVRAINSLTYSSVVSIKTGLVYCIPSYYFSCRGFSPEIGMKSFELNTDTLFTNSDNECGKYTFFKDQILKLNSGSEYAFNIKLDGISSYYAQHVAIWLDMNMDGSFSGYEKVFSTTASIEKSSRIEGTLKIPTVNQSIITRMRVRTRTFAEGIVDDPCMEYHGGETEDYLVNVQADVLGFNNKSSDSAPAVFPNPASSYIVLTDFFTKYEIQDIAGRNLMAGKRIEGGEIHLNLQEGIYFIRLTDLNGKKNTQKLKIER